MFERLLRRSRPEQDQALAIYTAIVAQARQPSLYRDHGVPDSVDGRFEMIVLHQVLLYHRFGPTDDEAIKVVQEVFDTFVADMDRSLREMGVGDLGVPKRMKAMGKSFYGRLSVYGNALAGNDRAGLAAALARNLFPEGQGPSLAPLADYAFASVDTLRGATRADLFAARLPFADPAAFAVVAAA
jgi:cytochrome b pre-mRNA-processing protein 3